MPTYTYKAHDTRAGQDVTNVIDADNEVSAVAMIKRMGYVPMELRAVQRRSALPALAGAQRGFRLPFGLFSGTSVKPAAITLFARQLSTLQDAGLPIVHSLTILGDMQRPGAFRNVIAEVRRDVEEGTMISDALAHHPRLFDKLYTNLVRAGESAGALDVILRRLAEFREKSQKLQKKILGALIYPAAVMTIAGGILTFIMICIVPRFEQIFREIGLTLPTVTQVLILVSSFIGSWWWAIALGIFGGFTFLRLWRQTETGGAIVDRLALRVPVLGNVIRKGAVARFTRTLGILVRSGVGFLEALEITRAATPNIVVQNAISDIRESVKEGDTINAPLAASGVFDDLVVNMIKVGEETGELDRMLMKIADTYDEEVDAAVAGMMALMEPLLVVFMGFVVGFIVIALFMPLLSMMDGMMHQT
jgi:type IV pilus assembly protein PilC